MTNERESDRGQVMAELNYLKQEVQQMANDDGDSSAIAGIISQFSSGKITAQEALEQARKIRVNKVDR